MGSPFDGCYLQVYSGMILFDNFLKVIASLSHLGFGQYKPILAGEVFPKPPLAFRFHGSSSHRKLKL